MHVANTNKKYLLATEQAYVVDAELVVLERVPDLAACSLCDGGPKIWEPATLDSESIQVHATPSHSLSEADRGF